MAPPKIKPLVDTIAEECLAVRLRMLNRVVSKLYDDALRPLELKVSQMNILVATGKLELAHPADLCQHLHLEVSTLSRNVERMKSRGWLEVVPQDDGRSQPIRLTSSGKRLLQKAAPAWKRAQSQAQSLLGKKAADLLKDAAGKLGSRTL